LAHFTFGASGNETRVDRGHRAKEDASTVGVEVKNRSALAARIVEGDAVAKLNLGTKKQTVTFRLASSKRRFMLPWSSMAMPPRSLPAASLKSQHSAPRHFAQPDFWPELVFRVRPHSGAIPRRIGTAAVAGHFDHHSAN
jgi:hypothetical protein